MKHKIRQKSTVLIFTLVLMIFVGHSFHHKNLAVAGLEALGQRAYEKFKHTLTHPDLLPLLPEVLPALKDPKFSDPDFHTPLFVFPTRLLNHLFIDARVLNKFIILLQEVPEIKAMFLDHEFVQIYGSSIAIDTLLALLRPGPGNQVKIAHALINVSRYGTLTITGSYFIGEYTNVDTTHTLTFTLTNANKKPVPGLPLKFSLQPLDDTAATAVFDPATAITNQNGSADVKVTFGSEPGSLRLIVDVDTQQIVELVELELTQRNNTRVESVTVKGMEHGFAPISTTGTLVFAAKDANGQPVPGEELTFSVRGASGSGVTATFSPAVATTDQNGEVRTRVTFGAGSGGFHLTVQAGSRAEQVNIVSSLVKLGDGVAGAFTGLEIGDSVDVGSTHAVVFTATDMRGKPVSGLPIVFDGARARLGVTGPEHPIGLPTELDVIPLTATFDPPTAITDRNGEARTRITFGKEPGAFELHVSIDPQRVIVFTEPELRLGATDIANLKIQGMEDGFAQPDSSRTLTFTATDAKGKPVAGQELVLGESFIPDGQTEVDFFQPLKIKTNKNGKAKTLVKFGRPPGVMRLIVKSGITIDAFVFDLAPYGRLELTKGLQIGDVVKANSTHDLVFTATNANGKPVPWLPLRLDAVDVDIFAHAATFAPASRVVTNKNGKVRTRITFGDIHEDIRLIATVDQNQLVEFPNPTPKILDDSEIDSVAVKGIEHGFARVGSTKKLLFTAKDKNGKPAAGVRLEFGFRSTPDSKATVIFAPTTATTDKNGEVETEAIFGPEAGRIRFTVKVRSGVILHSVSFDLTPYGTLELTKGLQIGDAVKANSTHDLVFTATNANGKPVPDLPLRLDAVDIDNLAPAATFAPTPQVVTNKNGKARTRIIFGNVHEDIRLVATVDREQIIEFPNPNPEIKREGSGIEHLTVKGIEHGFARIGSEKTLLFTAKDKDGKPISGVKLEFRLQYESDNSAVAPWIFDPLVAITDKNGEVETRVTFDFDLQPGRARFIIAPRDVIDSRKIEFTGWSHNTSYVDGEQLDLKVQGLFNNTAYRTGAKHKLTFTVTKRRTGKSVPLIQILLSIRDDSTTTATFNPPVITTDKNGKAETEVTFGNKPGKFGISVSTKYTGGVYYAFSFLESSIHGLYLADNLEGRSYSTGSKHKLTLTLKREDGSGEPVPPTFLSLNIRDDSTTTATFNPPVITTDKNGKAETEVTFGNKPGRLIVQVSPLPPTLLTCLTHDPYIPPPAPDGIYELVTVIPRIWSKFDTVWEEKAGDPVIVTVKFLNGTRSQRELVEEIAPTWSRYGGVRFKFVTSGKSDIRIRFDDSRSWSRLGTKAMELNESEPTMEIRLQPPNRTVYPKVGNREYPNMAVTGEEWNRGIILHEFGHALGFKHEHNSPNFASEGYIDIPTFKKALKGLGVTDSEIKRNYTAIVDYEQGKTREDITNSRFDINSVMLYPGLPLLSGGVTPLNRQLSAIDKAYTAQAYPRGPVSISVTGIKNNQWIESGDLIRPRVTVKVNNEALIFNEEVRFRVQGPTESTTFEWEFRHPNGSRIEPNYLVYHPTKTGPNGEAANARIALWGDYETATLSIEVPRFSLKKSFSIGVESLGVGSYDFPFDFRQYSHRQLFDGKRDWSHKITVPNPHPGYTTEPRITDVKFTRHGRGDYGCGLFGIGGCGSAGVYRDRTKWSGTTVTIYGWVEDGQHIYADAHATGTIGCSVDFVRPLPPGTESDIEIIVKALSAGAPANHLIADINRDGLVNVADVVLVSNNLGQTGLTNLRVDVNGDEFVTIADLIQVAQHLGQSIGSDPPTALVVPQGLTYATVEEWIDRARLVDDGSPFFRQGIANLELLLTLIIPEKTALLHNYPNPFNPETWIPYHLTEPAEVTLRIYAVDGKLVRTLALGHQAAGYYQNKSRAAYWDGRNNVGERVASGVYFYTLTAGDFTATRKMLIRK